MNNTQESMAPISLQEFLIDLATDSTLQARLSGLAGVDLRNVLVTAGMTPEDAELLVNAQESQEGKQKLIEKLTRWTYVPYHPHHWRGVVQLETGT